MSSQRELRCIELVESVTEWMEDALDDEDRLLVEAHLATCTPCGAYVAQLRAALALLPREPRPGPPAAVRAALLAAVRPAH